MFCSSVDTIAPEHIDLARRTGAELAARGHDLVWGGGRVSMMGAVAAAVRAGGRHTLGVIPQALAGREVADHEADELLVTADMRARKGLMDAHADAFLTLPGGLGTLEELLEIWVAATLGMHAKPVVVLDPGGLLAPLRALVDGLAATGFVRPGATDAVVWAGDVAAALDAVEQRLDSPVLPQALPGSGAADEEMLEAEP